MATITYEVKNLSPLLMNSPQAMAAPKEGMAAKRIPTPENEAESKAYRLPSGQLYSPSMHFRSSILNAVKNLKIGKSTARQIFSASLFLTDETCPLYDPDTLEPLMNYTVDIQRAVVQGNGVMRARPKLPKWGTRITFEYDEEFLSPDVITDAFVRAGKIAGIGDYRPACPKGAGGPYGRFAVERIAV